MISRIAMAAIAAMMAGVMLGGCAESNPEQEPWVSGERLKQERSRSDAQEDQLRERLARIQTDR